MNRKMLSIVILQFVMSMPAVAAADYFDVVPLSCREGSGSVKYEASVDFPVGGGREVMAAAKEWIGEILEVDGTMAEQDVSGMSADDFGRLLGRCGCRFRKDG